MGLRQAVEVATERERGMHGARDRRGRGGEGRTCEFREGTKRESRSEKKSSVEEAESAVLGPCLGAF